MFELRAEHFHLLNVLLFAREFSAAAMQTWLPAVLVPLAHRVAPRWISEASVRELRPFLSGLALGFLLFLPPIGYAPLELVYRAGSACLVVYLFARTWSRA